MAKVLVTGASGVAGRETTRQLLAAGYEVRMADVGAPPKDAGFAGVEFMRCDTRSPQDVEAAVAGCDGVVHLAAWHCGHVPPVSDATIFAVNVDGTFYVLEACVKFGIKTVAYASSMAYGHGGVYSVTKVIGEDLCRTWHHRTGRPITLLRYHDFVPKPYLAFGTLGAIAFIALATSPMVHLFGTEPEHLNLWVTRPPYVWLPAGPVLFALAGQVTLLRRLLADGQAAAPTA